MRNNDDWWRKLATDPDFEAEMCERQRQLGMIYHGPCLPLRHARHPRTMAGSPRVVHGYGVTRCSLVSVASHHPARPKLVAAVLGVMVALSTVALAGSAYTTAPTGSQVTLALVGSVLAGCLAARAGWPTTVSLKKIRGGSYYRFSDPLSGITGHGSCPVVLADLFP